jgi:hypothetical protein
VPHDVHNAITRVIPIPPTGGVPVLDTGPLGSGLRGR